MNKTLSILLVGLSTIIFFSCDKKSNCIPAPSVQSGTCIDFNLIGNADECIEIYDPVCGCDGVTYDNYCVADSSGITSYFLGECCD